MFLLNKGSFTQGLVLAGSLSLYSGTALAQSSAKGEHPEGRAGLATLCIEKRSRLNPETMTIETPSIYASEVPAEGIDTLYAKDGEIAKKWDAFVNPADKDAKAWLETTGIPDQAKYFFQLMKTFDDDGNGIISKAEFAKHEPGAEFKGPELIGYFQGAKCVSEFLRDGASNKIDPESLPIVIGLRGELKTSAETAARLSVENAALQKEKSGLQQENKNLRYLLIGACSLFGITFAGLATTLVRNRKKRDQAPKGEIPPKKEDPKIPEKKASTPPPLPPEPKKAEEKKPAIADLDDIEAALSAAASGDPAAGDPAAGGPSPDPKTP